jgi:hypothetical protein
MPDDPMIAIWFAYKKKQMTKTSESNAFNGRVIVNRGGYRVMCETYGKHTEDRDILLVEATRQANDLLKRTSKRFQVHMVKTWTSQSALMHR